MHPTESTTVARRGFLARLSAAAGTLGLLAIPERLGATLAAPAMATGSASRDDPDAWIARLGGHDRLMIHTRRELRTALGAAFGTLRDAREGYGVPERENSLAVMAHGSAIAGLFTDAVWQRFGLGERYGVNDAAGRPAVANPFLRAADDAPAGSTVPALQERGVLFVVCNVAVGRLAQRLAGESQNAQALHETLRAGLVPGVIAVPNVFVAISHAQRAGVGYLVVD